METQNLEQSKVRRTVNDLVLAEMFLLQATIESANAIGGGISELGRSLGTEQDDLLHSRASFTELLQRTADEAIEPYTSRFKYFRGLVQKDS